MRTESTKQFTHNGTVYFVNDIPGTSLVEISNESRSTVFIDKKEQFDGPAPLETIWKSIVCQAKHMLDILFSAKERALAGVLLEEIKTKSPYDADIPIIIRALKYYKEHV